MPITWRRQYRSSAWILLSNSPFETSIKSSRIEELAERCFRWIDRLWLNQHLGIRSRKKTFTCAELRKQSNEWGLYVSTAVKWLSRRDTPIRYRSCDASVDKHPFSFFLSPVEGREREKERKTYTHFWWEKESTQKTNVAIAKQADDLSQSLAFSSITPIEGFRWRSTPTVQRERCLSF